MKLVFLTCAWKNSEKNLTFCVLVENRHFLLFFYFPYNLAGTPNVSHMANLPYNVKTKLHGARVSRIRPIRGRARSMHIRGRAEREVWESYLPLASRPYVAGVIKWKERGFKHAKNKA